MGIRGKRDRPGKEMTVSPVTVTARTLEEIEVALATHKAFSFVRNVVAFNVIGESRDLPIWHECDMLVMSRSGYLTEIEIKRSWADFLADFRKRHQHDSPYGNAAGMKAFYYCLPSGCLDRAYDELDRRELFYTGIVTYDEDLRLEIHGHRSRFMRNGKEETSFTFPERGAEPLYLEQRLNLARLSSMRVITLKKKVTALQKNIDSDKGTSLHGKMTVSVLSVILKEVLLEIGHPQKDDAGFIEDRAALAEEEFQLCRQNGYRLSDAYSSSVHVLLEGLGSENMSL